MKELILRILSILLMVWSSARMYYFMFYVIEHYLDGKFRFSGVYDFLRYIFEINQQEAHLVFGGCETAHELLEVLVHSQYSQTIEELYGGILNVSHGTYDYEESVKILSKGFLTEEEKKLLKSALADSYNMTRIVSNEG